MDIFVISLDRSGDRKNTFDNNNSKYIKYTYFNAVDGNKIKIDRLSKNILKPCSKNYSNGAIGCAQSHLNLYGRSALN